MHLDIIAWFCLYGMRHASVFVPILGVILNPLIYELPKLFEPKAVRSSGTDALVVVVEELYFMFFKKRE